MRVEVGSGSGLGIDLAFGFLTYVGRHTRQIDVPRLSELAPGQTDSIGEITTLEVRPGKLRPTEGGTLQLSPSQVRPVQPRLEKVRILQLRPEQARSHHLCADRLAPSGWRIAGRPQRLEFRAGESGDEDG